MKEIKNIYNVPEGYFDRLEKRLEAIPSQQQEAAPTAAVPFLSKLGPYIALAACMVAAFLVGDFFLGRNQSVPSSEIGLSEYYMADLVPVTDPYSIFDDAPDDFVGVEESSEEDVLEYLISSGTSLDYLSYFLSE